MQRVRSHRPDYTIAIYMFILIAFGLVMMYNINPVLSQKLIAGSDGYYFERQLAYVAIAVIAWFIISRVYYEYLRHIALGLLVVTVVAMALLAIPELSFSKNGATRWLSLGPASFQPAELLKISFVLYLAVWLERKKEVLGSWQQAVVPFAVMLAFLSIFIVVFQRDMGTMMVVVFSSLALLFIAGARIQHFIALVAGLLGAGIAAIAVFPHRVERFLTFLSPTSDASGTGYHISQALIAIGSGGIFGLGLGKSIQIYGYLPEASNDSIFAVIAEEFGILGTSLVLVLFGLLVYRGVRVAISAPNNFARYLAFGITITFASQALINIAAMLSLVPLTGIPLPFISYGGSSLLVMVVCGAILFNISKYTVLSSYTHAPPLAVRSKRRQNSVIDLRSMALTSSKTATKSVGGVRHARSR